MTSTTHPPVQRMLLQRDAAFYLCSAISSLTSADLLHALFCRHAEGPEADAIWDGHWALLHQAQDSISGLRDSGGLLFFGQQAALEVAKAVAA
ncbi:hypothetical protein [Delftia acidovorans]|uniref:hypothetical protein n=1 Tax=Delftia acidovorans TaxID=80866 RepID=UPI0005C249C8|nr:hypothetical protein [Delftia acidovorans]QPS76365.1 hypothetical protein I6G48_07380 [Delftia acidovorans]